MMNSITDIVNYLKVYMGRPVIAYMLNQPNANIITRWSIGKETPSSDITLKLAIIYGMFKQLEPIAGSPDIAAQWFTGNNQLLNKMPAEVFREGDYSSIFAAIKNLYND